MSSNRAFTLLELLVVITIIGILSSIVIVSMSGSTDSATIAKGKAYAQQVHALLGHEAVLALSFNENAYNTCSDGADVCDASGYGNNGIIYNNEATFVSSPIDGYTLSFDGVNDYVETFNPQFLGNDFTIVFWFKNNDTDHIHGRELFSQRENLDGTADAQALYHTTAHKLVYTAKNNGISVYSVGISNTVEHGEWHHVAVGRNGSLLFIYIDGVNVTSGSVISGDLPEFDVKLSFGKSSGYWAYAFEGLEDDVRIYSVALPSTEIQKHYVQGLEKLLANHAITQAEYNQRMEEFNKYLASNRF
jgi:prepilin-type N-terminal cleavage/methylation domain-containing protein